MASQSSANSQDTAEMYIDPSLLTNNDQDNDPAAALRGEDESMSTQPSKTLNDNDFSTTHHALSSTATTLSQTTSPESCYFVDNLFGPGTGPVPIVGSRSALNQLKKDKSFHGLFVQSQIPSSVQEAVTISHHHLRMLDSFSDVEHLVSNMGLQRDASNPFGIDADDQLDMQADPSLAFTYLNFDMSKALAALKKLAVCHDQVILLGRNEVINSAYQIGVITSGTGTVYKVEVFNSCEATACTATIWLYRACSIDVDGMIQEIWRPLSDGTYVTPTMPAQATTTEVSSKKRTADAIEDNVSTASEAGTTHDGPVKRARQNATYPRDTPCDWLFTTCPEDVSGNAVLHLARWYSNTELFECLNYNLSAQKKRLIVDINVVTRRITNAINTMASSTPGLTREGLRADLNAARRANGVNARMDARTKIKKDFNKAARKIIEELVDGDGYVEGVEEDVEEDVVA